jgi:hypothetical protein
MVKYLYNIISANSWLGVDPTTLATSISEGVSRPHLLHTGVLLRQSHGTYVTQPAVVHPELMSAVQKINVEVAFTMTTEITKLIFDNINSDQTDCLLPDGSQYQIVDSMSAIATNSSSEFKRFQYTCLVRREKLVLIWHDDVQQILEHAGTVERSLLSLVCDAITPLVIHFGEAILLTEDRSGVHTFLLFRPRSAIPLRLGPTLHRLYPLLHPPTISQYQLFR